MQQFGWAIECSEIWSNIILSIFWMKLIFEMVDWAKHFAFPDAKRLTYSYMLSNKELLNAKLGHESFPVFELELKQQLFMSFEFVSFQNGTYTMSSPVSQAFWIKLEIHHHLSQFSRLRTRTETISLTLLGL